MPKIGMTRLGPLLNWPAYFYQGLNRQYFRKVEYIQNQDLIGLWPQWEPSGSVAYDLSPQGNNGAYTTATLGEIGIGDGRSCAFFDGANDYNNIYSAGFAADVNFSEGTFALWLKVAAASVWTDGTTDIPIHIGADGANNFIRIDKSTANNRIQLHYKAGGTLESITKDAMTEIGWMHMAITWSKTADQMIAYYNGVQEGIIQTGLGVWAGAANNSLCVIGAQTKTPANPFHGWIAIPGVWNAPLSATKIKALSVR